MHGTNLEEHFNPRTRTGCDRQSDREMYENLIFQSTHPHGVRLLPPLMPNSPGRFQSTHPHGVRPNSCLTCFLSLKFQSTHPHGVRRRQLQPLEKPEKNFNPRTRTGCDKRSQHLRTPSF